MTHFTSFLDKNGRVKVNEFFQITENDPIDYLIHNPAYQTQEKKDIKIKIPLDGKTHAHIFCFGDACSTLMQEEKSIPSISATVDIVAHNLCQIAYEKYPQLIQMPEALDKVNVIPYNSQNGPMIVNGFSINLRCFTNLFVKKIS